MLKLTDMEKFQRSEFTSRKFNIVGICATVCYAQKWISKL
jgi:hypothetical protein